MNILVTFSSRNASIKFCDVLRRGGVPSILVNTPRDLSVACGISVSVEERFALRVAEVLRTFDKTTYLGTYKLVRSGRKTVAIPLR